MKIRRTLQFLTWALASIGVAQNDAQDAALAPSACAELNRKFMNHAATGQSKAAESTIADVLAGAAAAAGASCTGLLLNNLAVRLELSGRAAEAERVAEQSIQILGEQYPPDDPVFFRPLQMLATLRLEHGEIGRAREAFQKMQTIRIKQPLDRALLHGMSATLLVAEGRYRDAEAEYLVSLRTWEEAGRGNMADSATILTALGTLYIREQRFDDAGRMLDRALSIFSSAADAVPMDRLKLLNIRAELYAHQKRWRNAEDDLRDAVSIADRLPGLDPVALSRVLADYAYVLRKNHRGQEARLIDARANALHAVPAAEAVVDMSELSGRAKGGKR